MNIPYDGRVIVKREVYYNPERDDANPDPYVQMKEWLGFAARKMEQKDELPDEPLLIRADAVTSFKHLQKLMEFCGEKGVQIWKIQLAAAETETDDKEK